MASKEELLEKNKSELMELAQERELEGRSGMSKEELAEALADDSSSDRTVSEEEEAAVADEKLAEIEEQAGSEHAELAADEMDAPGPLHLESPSQRVMTGAVNEEQAKEQEELLKNKPEDWTGDTTEAGFDAKGNAVVKPSDEEQAALTERREARLSKKENLGEGDDREIMEVKQEDVIDFPKPRGEEAEKEGLKEQAAVEGAPFTTTTVAGGQGRVFHQKSVFYTDGLGGPAEQNLERAYEIPELLQSNNPAVREAGDESLSEAAKEEKSEGEAKEAERVKTRDDDPSETSRNSG